MHNYVRTLEYDRQNTFEYIDTEWAPIQSIPAIHPRRGIFPACGLETVTFILSQTNAGIYEITIYAFF